MKIKLKKVKCLRCGYEWAPKIEDVRTCAKCKSALWDKPKKGKIDRLSQTDTTPSGKPDK